MKVYVDELPKDCIDCPCECEYYCNLLNEDVGCLEWGEIHKGCPLQSLADYTKQVRKEVCEEIREWHDEECESLDLDSDFDVGYSGALSNLWGILDQIEGKPKD